MRQANKILLIGKKGQLASAIVENAARFNFEITAVDREELDATKYQELEQKIKDVHPAIVLNASAYNTTLRAEEEAAEAFLLNFEAVRSMAKICREMRIQFVTYSTDYVFDGAKSAPYSEDDCPNPLQVYGISKIAGEYAALNYHPDGTLVIRTCGLYGGKEGSPAKGNIVLNLLKEAKDKEKIEVSSVETVSPTYAFHLAEASLKLLKIGVSPGVYHLVNEGYCSWYDFAKKLMELAGVTVGVVPVKAGKQSGGMRRPKFSALANIKAKQLGIVLPPWQEGLADYVTFLKDSRIIA